MSEALEELERTLKHHCDAQIKNYERFRSHEDNKHTTAICKVLSSLLSIFNDRKVFFIVEAEISELQEHARPEDIVGWIEGIGIFVVEVKSHLITGIKSFENNIPQVIYRGKQGSDCDLLDQPSKFAYRLKAVLEKAFDDHNLDVPPLYFAGWLPNISPNDLLRLNAIVAEDKVWLSDMLERETFLTRFKKMKNITRGGNTERSALELFSNLFGVTSGLRTNRQYRQTMPGSVGNLLDRRTLELKTLTDEQEKLAFSSNLVRGTKVIRGVAGSGKTIVLANAVAEVFLREYRQTTQLDCFKNEKTQILVICYNRTLVSYLKKLIQQCFEASKPDNNWKFPQSQIQVINIDRYIYELAKEFKLSYNPDDRQGETIVTSILAHEFSKKHYYNHIFIDEGQDIELHWYPLICQLAKSSEDGPSIIIFYDDAQNIYGVKLPTWKNVLGTVPNSRGLKTIMRVGHRNTNQILSFSFNLLLGAFSDFDPEMATFADINQYVQETIPDDSKVDHPNAGKPCVERLDKSYYKINFAVQSGSVPNVHLNESEIQMLEALVKELKRCIDPTIDNVDPQDILVMAPTIEDVEKIIKECQEQGLKVHCPIKLDKTRNRISADPRDQDFFQKGKITVSTIRSAKGFTAHICHVTFIHKLKQSTNNLKAHQQARAQLHVACTRATLFLSLWGTECQLMEEAELIVNALH